MPNLFVKDRKEKRVSGCFTSGLRACSGTYHDLGESGIPRCLRVAHGCAMNTDVCAQRGEVVHLRPHGSHRSAQMGPPHASPLLFPCSYCWSAQPRLFSWMLPGPARPASTRISISRKEMAASSPRESTPMSLLSLMSPVLWSGPSPVALQCSHSSKAGLQSFI